MFGVEASPVGFCSSQRAQQYVSIKEFLSWNFVSVYFSQRRSTPQFSFFIMFVRRISDLKNQHLTRLSLELERALSVFLQYQDKPYCTVRILTLPLSSRCLSLAGLRHHLSTTTTLIHSLTIVVFIKILFWLYSIKSNKKGCHRNHLKRFSDINKKVRKASLG